ncbi:GNAT family N-acetyltransferase [Alsobacter sp. SYSU M60028]|uniref:GNAT family N-acetyltransferase n=1 Tax=Alsobacter ponti TaxID=2962936 RepID=A0ABT1LAT2_9HYPH|nr:GNAT family N-acetyltransferase [Alsobacter ponti]MCP8938063.1 GNAT family N-acetyltransferase [Alsobacter ponti]
MSVRLLAPAEARRRIPDLAAVLLDCVEGGASVSFMDGFSMAEAVGFYADVVEAVEAGQAYLFAAFEGDHLVGTVQLWPADKPNQPHRCDIAKMLVHRDARRAGHGERLMRAAEAHAKSLGKSLLTLDTQEGDAADRLYRRLGWQAIGTIPGYALWPDGRPCDTVFFYKQI